MENHPFVRSVDVEIDRLEAEGRSIYTIGEEEDEGSFLNRAEDGTSLDPTQETNLTNKQREIMSDVKNQ